MSRETDAASEAEHFLRHEKEFHLGFLPSESANPLTARLDEDFAESTAKGVRTLLSVDNTLPPIFERVLGDERLWRMTAAMRRAIENGGRVIFSGCGATGRLSLLLEAAWREHAQGVFKDSVGSIMTGGDFALVRSVEFFEDYQQFGRRQVEELGLEPGDVLVGITATGETASIIGSVMEAAERGASVFLLICVPKEIPTGRLERCRAAYSHPNVTVLDMPCGGMAVAGSTRMQSTTLEMVAAAAALEHAAGFDTGKYSEAFSKLLRNLGSPSNVDAIAGQIDFETDIYRGRGLVTYFADEFLLDILTDTTERSPTFMLPPFRRRDDFASPVSWAFVKNPTRPTEEAWLRCFRRIPRCLEWTLSDYEDMGASELVRNGLPQIGREDLLKIMIGNEESPERKDAVKIPVDVDRRRISAGKFEIETNAQDTPLRLFEHLSAKLVLNIISTGTMVKMGRVSGNRMTWLDVSNKKLIDRGIRIIAEQCGLPYAEACSHLFESIHELKDCPADAERQSPVRFTIDKLKAKKEKDLCPN